MTVDLYRNAAETVRPTFLNDQNHALEYYADVVEFVRAVSAPGTEPNRTALLDVGCGNGWSTFAYAKQGYVATGIDLSRRAFEPPQTERLSLLEGSALEIAFPDNTFEVVVAYQCLEHLPDPERALSEMSRVCKPNGCVVIVGPNLVTPFVPVAFLSKAASWRAMRIWRTADMPHHPYGNTLPELVVSIFRCSLQLIWKICSPVPHFSMRAPDTRPPFHSDNDACFLCNPIDLIKYFKLKRFSILRRGKPGRPTLSYVFAGGTWIAAKKPMG